MALGLSKNQAVSEIGLPDAARMLPKFSSHSKMCRKYSPWVSVSIYACGKPWIQGVKSYVICGHDCHRALALVERQHKVSADPLVHNLGLKAVDGDCCLQPADRVQVDHERVNARHNEKTAPVGKQLKVTTVYIRENIRTRRRANRILQVVGSENDSLNRGSMIGCGMCVQSSRRFCLSSSFKSNGCMVYLTAGSASNVRSPMR
jgi:hypothetical protein